MKGMTTVRMTPQALKSVMLSGFFHAKHQAAPRVIAPSKMEESEFNEIFNGVETDKEHCRRNIFYKGNWLKECLVSVAELASAGFCPTGKQDEVVCFSCRGKVAGWCAFELPVKIHAEVYPDCQITQDILKETGESTRRGGTQFDSPIQPTGVTRSDGVFDIGGIPSSSSEYSASDMIFYASEFNRLLTFSEWPLLNPVDRYDLAATGFICPDEKKEETVCVGCGLEVKEWKLGDMPERRHAAESPKCPFVVKKEDSNRKMDNIEKLQYVTRGVTANK